MRDFYSTERRDYEPISHNDRGAVKRSRITLLILFMSFILAVLIVFLLFQTGVVKTGDKARPIDHLNQIANEMWQERLYIGPDFTEASNDILVLPYAEYSDLYANYLKTDLKAYIRSIASGETATDVLRNKVCYSVPQAGKKVAITFDDGPYPKRLDQYLEILDKYNVNATFFCLGRYIENYPEAAQKIANAGHEIGIHSWYHEKMTSLSQQELKDNFTKSSTAFYNAIGYMPYLFRPPYGSVDDNVKAAASNAGMVTVCWNVDTRDWATDNAQKVINSVMNNVSDGAIILMHENRKSTIAALPQIIEGLQKRGYELVTVGELIYSAQKDQ